MDSLGPLLMERLEEEAELRRIEDETEAANTDEKIKWTKGNNKATKALINLREEYHSRFEQPKRVLQII